MKNKFIANSFAFLLTIVFITPKSFSQNAYITPALQQRLGTKENNGENLKVAIILKDRTDLVSLEEKFEREKTTMHQRAKTTIRELMKTATASQQSILDYVKMYQLNNPGSVSDIETLWIVNVITISAHPSLVKELAKRSDISYMELVSENSVTLFAPVEEHYNIPESLNGVEAGLKAINAPALWKLGYTGRNRLLLSFDTGVYPDHPAHGERFLGYHFPLKQSWFGYDHYFPGDKDGTHGTHTIGTVLGLEKSTNDTIGVAFNAYYIATDPIVTDLSKIKPMTEIIKGFQWALNPDGDTSTTDDMPDVINNSWGKPDPPDTIYCDSYVSDLFNALELAGIAFVFSAGNNGPQSATIRLPQFIATNDVNIFTAGSVDGNTAGYPISSFSSRGPTTCPATGSVLIKPEVVAPGQNVRSSVGHNGYANFSGTSMAAPHVSGAVLLLKEAYPFLTGKEILLALYNTAIDLGTAGEDNTYGRGIIDVEAAFLYLSISHSSVPPKITGFDLEVSKILGIPPIGYSCDSSFSPILVFTNRGDSTIHNISITYLLDDTFSYSENWAGILLPGESDTLGTFTFSIFNSGYHTIAVSSEINPQVDEIDAINNHRFAWFNTRSKQSLPFYESFDSTNLNYGQWYIENTDDGETWTSIESGGNGDTTSVMIPFASYLPRSRQQDGLISPSIVLSDSGNLTLSFDMAYKTKNSAFKDSLYIEVSQDCGITYPITLYANGGADMNTHAGGPTDPSDASHWATFSIDISHLSGTGNSLFRFRGVNDNGGNLYLDNILISDANASAIDINPKPALTLYPNPANDIMFIKQKGLGSEITDIAVYNLTGKMVKKVLFSQNQEAPMKINIDDLVSGIYIISVCNPQGCQQSKMVKIEK